ncbi:TetR/AcrR family transcriptional regulator [Streptomyces sp. TRM66268-LWL]|uniref:TetR/AcrR family transcriptional regulator n=1 Tax=Streptomyces polyasparticus TaxID=2767826 RepID=A0ABR7SI95_9ACTN|nr:TetR/AcrR family transcriptional regulator [Streptomyces polyasparticus]MBC9715158.1 TetR/AcrR family transcriptional regulator [Streptomyces polyasparticus]
MHAYGPSGATVSEQRAASTPTRRRGAALETAITDAAWQILLDQGYNGFTYEAVAARAGTSKPVLYRRWPQREDLLTATIARHWRPLEVPDTGSLREDALTLLRTVNAERGRALILLRVQLADYFRDTGTSFDDLRNRLHPQDRTPPFALLVSRAVERGELADVPRSRRVVNLPFDLVRHDMLMRMGAVPDDSIVEIVDEVWSPLLGPAPHAP